LASFSFLPSIQTTNSTSTNAPGGPQAGALNTIYGGLADAYSRSTAMGPYSGNFYAGSNPFLSGAYSQAGNFGQTYGNLPGQQISSGQGLLNNYGTAGNAAGALYNFGNTNQTQNNISTANQYANNPYIEDAIAAATKDGRRAATEGAIPNLYRSAAASGNINSDRAALAQGVVERSLADNAQEISARMRSEMFNTGLGTALTQNQQGLGALSNSGSLGAALGGAGSSMMSQGINDQANLAKIYESAGLGIQGQEDRGLANDQARYQTNYQFPWQNLQNYYGIAGNNNWWGSQNTQGTSVGISPVQNQPSPGALSYLGAGLGMAGSLAGLGMGGGSTLGGMALGGLYNRAFGGSGGGMSFPIAAPGGGFFQGGWR